MEHFLIQFRITIQKIERSLQFQKAKHRHCSHLNIIWRQSWELKEDHNKFASSNNTLITAEFTLMTISTGAFEILNMIGYDFIVVPKTRGVGFSIAFAVTVFIQLTRKEKLFTWKNVFLRTTPYRSPKRCISRTSKKVNSINMYIGLYWCSLVIAERRTRCFVLDWIVVSWVRIKSKRSYKWFYLLSFFSCTYFM